MNASQRAASAIKTAVIGYGLAGRVFHCPYIAAVPGLELAAIVQRRGDEAAIAYPSAAIARDIEEVLNDPSIELVVVATPNPTHFDLAQRTLEAGKHCVVDKPFAATSGEAAMLLKLARQKALHIFPFHNRRFDGDFLTLREILAKGELGRVVEISSRFDRFRAHIRDNSWKEIAGDTNGLLYDLGSHLLDQALALFGKPDSIGASIYRDREGTSIDDAFEVTLSYAAQGLRYRCGSTLLAADAAPRFRVNGTLGSYTKYGVDPQEAAVGGGMQPPIFGTREPWLPESDNAWGTLTQVEDGSVPATLTRIAYPTLAGDYRLFYENVRASIQANARPALLPEDGYRCIRLLELALESNAQQRSVDVHFDY